MRPYPHRFEREQQHLLLADLIFELDCRLIVGAEDRERLPARPTLIDHLEIVAVVGELLRRPAQAADRLPHLAARQYARQLRELAEEQAEAEKAGTDPTAQLDLEQAIATLELLLGHPCGNERAVQDHLWRTQPIEVLGVSTAACNRLAEPYGITTVGRLLLYTEADLLDIYNFGEGSLKRIQHQLPRHHYPKLSKG